MNIGLILDPYGEKSPGGLGRAIFEMAKGLLTADHSNAYTVYVKGEPLTRPELPGNNWKLKTLGKGSLFLYGARTIGRDSAVCIFFNPIIPLFFFPKKSIVVVHDFAYLEIPSRSFKQKTHTFFLYCAHALSLWKATNIVAVSEATKQSTMRHFNISPEKIRVIYNGSITFSGVPHKVETPELFFLFAGVLKERKNVAGVIRAFVLFAQNNVTHELLIAGKQGGAYAESLLQLVRECGIEKRVHFVGYVTDAELAYLYRRAEALVFPSFIEGFGMPVLEAMHAGLPVITSNKGALAEVAGDAALLVDPARPEDIAAAMSRIAVDAPLRASLITKGKERAALFSWEKAGREFYDILATLTL